MNEMLLINMCNTHPKDLFGSDYDTLFLEGLKDLSLEELNEIKRYFIDAGWYEELTNIQKHINAF
jgi:hypothetical protein